MSRHGPPVQQRHLELAEALEARFAVARWDSGDVDLWPPARMDLFLDLFRASGGDTAPPGPGRARRIAGALALPLTNAWKSRGDLAHWRPRAGPADAILLGDGVSLDRVDGSWRDRHGEPVMAALERQGRSTLLMQPGALERLPWARPTFPANTIAVRGALAAALRPSPPVRLPDHDGVLAFLKREGVQAPSLDPGRLARRAHAIAGAAAAFQRVLHVVRPRLAFVVTYYAGLGHAFALACRREGVMCVDLQHCPQGRTHRAYRWRDLPAGGFSTLPAVFWTWSAEEADHIMTWAGGERPPWHRALHGGHAQLSAYLDGPSDAARAPFETVDGAFEREILVALQPIGSRRAVWEILARQIAEAPADWRWWIRRHPSSTPHQDAEYQGLLRLERPNVVVRQASDLPLPALLRRMSVLVSLASGAAAEAAAFGVPALFLDPEALATFPELIARGQAHLVPVAGLGRRIALLPARPDRRAPEPPPPIEETLQRLDQMALDYARLCRTSSLEAGRDL